VETSELAFYRSVSCVQILPVLLGLQETSHWRWDGAINPFRSGVTLARDSSYPSRLP
jgi:hypothetical protein